MCKTVQHCTVKHSEFLQKGKSERQILIIRSRDRNSGRVAAIRPEIQSLDPILNICRSELPVCKKSECITLLHGFTHVEIALKAQNNCNEQIGGGFYRCPPHPFLNCATRPEKNPNGGPEKYRA